MEYFKPYCNVSRPLTYSITLGITQFANLFCFKFSVHSYKDCFSDPTQNRTGILRLKSQALKPLSYGIESLYSAEAKQEMNSLNSLTHLKLTKMTIGIKLPKVQTPTLQGFI